MNILQKYLPKASLLACLLCLHLSCTTSSSSSDLPLSNGLALEGVYLRTVTSYGLSGVYVENVAYLLLKDGSIYREPSVSPDELDVAASKQKEPKKWGTWKRAGSTLNVTWSNGKTEAWTKWFELKPAKAGGTLVGTFKSSDGFGGAAVANFNTVSFSSSGQFSWGKLKGGDTSWKPIYSSQQTAGTYQLNGYSMTLRFNNGQTEKYFFAYYPDKDNYFVLGSSHFVPRK